MTSQDLQNLRMIFISLEQGDIGILKALGIKVSGVLIHHPLRLLFRAFVRKLGKTKEIPHMAAVGSAHTMLSSLEL